jgi:hypothetical protein
LRVSGGQEWKRRGEREGTLRHTRSTLCDS